MSGFRPGSRLSCAWSWADLAPNPPAAHAQADLFLDLAGYAPSSAPGATVPLLAEPLLNVGPSVANVAADSVPSWPESLRPPLVERMRRDAEERGEVAWRNHWSAIWLLTGHWLLLVRHALGFCGPGHGPELRLVATGMAQRRRILTAPPRRPCCWLRADRAHRPALLQRRVAGVGRRSGDPGRCAPRSQTARWWPLRSSRAVWLRRPRRRGPGRTARADGDRPTQRSVWRCPPGGRWRSRSRLYLLVWLAGPGPPDLVGPAEPVDRRARLRGLLGVAVTDAGLGWIGFLASRVRPALDPGCHDPASSSRSDGACVSGWTRRVYGRAPGADHAPAAP